METFFGILIGVLATTVVGHYYFRKTTLKRITPYLNLSLDIFAGIEENVRKMLRFTFMGKEVKDLQQLEFLIANDGEKAISACIEPLTLELPKGTDILDTSVLFKSPSDLTLEVRQLQLANGNLGVSFAFPLMNKGDFFLAKLLLSGKVRASKLTFHVLADDLPRTLSPKRLPSDATRKRKWKWEWAAVLMGLCFLIFTASTVYALILLQEVKPDIFPIPWKTFHPSILNVALIVSWTVSIIVMGLSGISIALAFGRDEVLKTGPKFTLPDDLQRHGGHFNFPQNLEEMDDESEEPAQKEVGTVGGTQP